MEDKLTTQIKTQLKHIEKKQLAIKVTPAQITHFDAWSHPGQAKGYVTMTKSGQMVISGLIKTDDVIKPSWKRNVTEVYFVGDPTVTKPLQLWGELYQFLADFPQLKTVSIDASVNVSHLTSLFGFFANDEQLTEVKGFSPLSEVNDVDLQNCFKHDVSLSSLTLGDGVDLSTKQATDMLVGCTALTTLTFGTNTKSKVANLVGLDLTRWDGIENDQVAGTIHRQSGVPATPMDADKLDAQPQFTAPAAGSTSIDNNTTSTSDNYSSVNDVSPFPTDMMESKDDTIDSSSASLSAVPQESMVDPQVDEKAAETGTQASDNQVSADEVNVSETSLESDAPLETVDASMDAVESSEDDTFAQASVLASATAQAHQNLAPLQQQFQQMQADTNLAGLTKQVTETMQTMERKQKDYQQLAHDWNQHVQLWTQWSATTSPAPSPAVNHDASMAASTWQTASGRMHQYIQQVQLAYNTVNNAQLDMDSVTDKGLHILDDANQSADQGVFDSQTADVLHQYVDSLTAVKGKAQSAVDYSQQMVDKVGTTLSAASQACHWFVAQNQSVAASKQALAQQLDQLQVDMQDDQATIQSVAANFANVYEKGHMIASYVKEGLVTIKDVTTVADNVMTSLSQHLAQLPPVQADIKAQYDKMGIINQQIAHLNDKQQELVDKFEPISFDMDEANQTVNSTAAVVPHLSAQLNNGSSYDYAQYQSFSDQFEDLADMAQGAYDETSVTADSVGTFKQLGSANVDTVNSLNASLHTLASQVDFSLSLMSSDASDDNQAGMVIHNDIANAEAQVVNDDMDSDAVEDSEVETVADTQVAQSSQVSSSVDDMSMASASQSDLTAVDVTKIPLYDDFDKQQQVLKNLMMIKAPLLMANEDDEETTLDPTSAPIFSVLSVKSQGNGQYEIQIKYQKQLFSAITDVKALAPAYYWHGQVMRLTHQQTPFKLKCLQMVASHQQLDFSDMDSQRYYLDDILEVAGMDVYQGVPRFKLTNGLYVTANKYFVKVLNQ